MRRYVLIVVAALCAAVCTVALAGTALASSWTALPGGNIDYHAADFVDSSHGWVGGVTYTPAGQVGIEPTAVIGRTDSGGGSWQHSTSHEAGGVSFGWNFLTATAIDFTDQLHGWAALSDGTIVATTTGGAHWALQAEGSFEFRDNNWSYPSLSMADSTHGVAVGGWVGFIGVTYPRIVYTDNGRDWKTAAFPKPDNSSLESVCMVDSQYGWAVGSAGPTDSMPLVLATHDGGATWARQTKGLPTTGIDFHGVSFTDRQHGWAVGDFGAIYVTVDGGATWWSQPSGVSAALRAVSFITPVIGWAVGEKGTILETTTGGRTWTLGIVPAASVSAPTLRGVTSAGEHVWAVGDGGTILTTATPELVPSTGPFTDIDGSPYKTAIESLAAADLVGGFPDRTFRPNAAVLRAQFAKLIVGALGIVPGDSTVTRFTDLGTPDPNGYPHRYVEAAFDHAITNGVNAAQTLFAPWNPIRRDQVVSMIVRGAKSLMVGVLVGPPAGTPSLFAGVGEPHGENLRIAEYNGLLDGLTGLGPDWSVSACATRGEVAQMLYNLRKATTPTGASGDSGIHGLVTIGPISPVERPGEPNVRPYSATLLIKHADGTTAAEVTSGEDGRFTVNLAPGQYVLEPRNGSPLPIAQPQDVTVAPHAFTEVTVQYDSGIR